MHYNNIDAACQLFKGMRVTSPTKLERPSRGFLRGGLVQVHSPLESLLPGVATIILTGPSQDPDCAALMQYYDVMVMCGSCMHARLYTINASAARLPFYCFCSAAFYSFLRPPAAVPILTWIHHLCLVCPQGVGKRVVCVARTPTSYFFTRGATRHSRSRVTTCRKTLSS